MMASQSAHASLLGIPRELRDAIIHEVLRGCTPPTTPQDATETRFRTIGNRREKIIAVLDPPKPTALSLLLTNRQLCAETTEESRQNADARLDIMFVEEREIWPTWTQVPINCRNFETIEANMRVIGLPNLELRS